MRSSTTPLHCRPPEDALESRMLELLEAREGHFRLESGHHGHRWLDLDPLFLRPARLRGMVAVLAERLAHHGAEAICGPLIGGAFVAQFVAEELGAEFYYTERHPSDCGTALFSVEYRIPTGLRDLIGGKIVAIVDDVINAGSATRATYADLLACGAKPVALGALLTLGSGAARFAVEAMLQLEQLATLDNTIWTPEDCPYCAAGIPLEALT